MKPYQHAFITQLLTLNFLFTSTSPSYSMDKDDVSKPPKSSLAFILNKESNEEESAELSKKHEATLSELRNLRTENDPREWRQMPLITIPGIQGHHAAINWVLPFVFKEIDPEDSTTMPFHKCPYSNRSYTLKMEGYECLVPEEILCFSFSQIQNLLLSPEEKVRRFIIVKNVIIQQFNKLLDDPQKWVLFECISQWLTPNLAHYFLEERSFQPKALLKALRTWEKRDSNFPGELAFPMLNKIILNNFDNFLIEDIVFLFNKIQPTTLHKMKQGSGNFFSDKLRDLYQKLSYENFPDLQLSIANFLLSSEQSIIHKSTPSKTIENRSDASSSKKGGSGKRKAKAAAKTISRKRQKEMNSESLSTSDPLYKNFVLKRGSDKLWNRSEKRNATLEEVKSLKKTLDENWVKEKLEHQLFISRRTRLVKQLKILDTSYKGPNVDEREEARGKLRSTFLVQGEYKNTLNVINNLDLEAILKAIKMGDSFDWYDSEEKKEAHTLFVPLRRGLLEHWRDLVLPVQACPHQRKSEKGENEEDITANDDSTEEEFRIDDDSL